MEDKTKVTFAAFESQGTRLERANKRLFILNVILLIVLLATNGAWIYYESQFSVEQTQVIKAEQDSGNGGNNYIIGGDYGKTESNSDDY